MSNHVDIAPDVNLLIRPSSRRLLHGLALELGIDLSILPEVMKETTRRAGKVEAQRWLGRIQHRSPIEKEAILGAVEERHASQG